MISGVHAIWHDVAGLVHEETADCVLLAKLDGFFHWRKCSLLR